MAENPPAEQKRERIYAVGLGMSITSLTISIAYGLETTTAYPTFSPTAIAIGITSAMCIGLIYEAEYGRFAEVNQ